MDVAQVMKRNEAAARHGWARQHTWLLLSFSPFPVLHTLHPLNSCDFVVQGDLGDLFVVFLC